MPRPQQALNTAARAKFKKGDAVFGIYKHQNSLGSFENHMIGRVYAVRDSKDGFHYTIDVQENVVLKDGLFLHRDHFSRAILVLIPAPEALVEKLNRVQHRKKLETLAALPPAPKSAPGKVQANPEQRP